MKIPDEILKRIWSLPDGTIPLVHALPWVHAMPTNFRAACLAPDNPVPVTERRRKPDWLRGLKTVTQLVQCGDALLKACDVPGLRLSLAGGHLLRATGTTILLVERRRDGEILSCPWSIGEGKRFVLKRLISLRSAEAVRLNAQESYIADRLLPRCAAAISVVSGFGIENPGTNILASGGECPIAVTIGTDSIHFALDHRIYDPADAGALYASFFAALEGNECSFTSSAEARESDDQSASD